MRTICPCTDRSVTSLLDPICSLAHHQTTAAALLLCSNPPPTVCFFANERKWQAEQARLAAAAKDRELLKGLEPIVYPSRAQLHAGGAREPSQRIGDYALIRSEHETGRVFSSVKELGAPGGVPAGQEVRPEGV